MKKRRETSRISTFRIFSFIAPKIHSSYQFPISKLSNFLCSYLFLPDKYVNEGTNQNVCKLRHLWVFLTSVEFIRKLLVVTVHGASSERVNWNRRKTGAAGNDAFNRAGYPEMGKRAGLRRNRRENRWVGRLAEGVGVDRDRRKIHPQKRRLADGLVADLTSRGSLGGQDQWVRRGARNFMGFHNNERIVWYRTGGSVKWRERWEKSSC